MSQQFTEENEPCIAFDPDPDGRGALCASRAEPGSPYCIAHQELDIDPQPVGVLPVFGPIAAPVGRHALPAAVRAELIRTGHCPCDPTIGQSCRNCDGTDAEEREFWHASPAQRRAYLRGLREWNRTQTQTQTIREGNVA